MPEFDYVAAFTFINFIFVLSLYNDKRYTKTALRIQYDKIQSLEHKISKLETKVAEL